MNMIKDICSTHAPTPHDSYICHGTIEQRSKILKKVKCMLKGFDARKCVLSDGSTKKKRGFVPSDPSEKRNGLQPLPCDRLATKYPPLITYTGVQEIRLTSNPNRVADDPPDVIYKPAPNLKKARIPMDTPGRAKSVELKGGIFYGTCFCVKRNGLQGDCPRSACLGRPECLAISPGPCCEPAKAYLGKQQPSTQQQLGQQHVGKLLQDCNRRGSEESQYGQAGGKICCCCYQY